MSEVLSATKARANFFNLLNRVLYGGETVFIAKSGADSIVKLERVSSSRKILKSLEGSIIGKDARLMKKSIEASRKYPRRKKSSFT